MSVVDILGCGPTGLLCAWAAEQAGHHVTIISRKVKSEIPGSQHLHGPVPGLTSPYPEGTIQFVRIGTAEGYARKVYGDVSRDTGWDNYLQVYPSWKIIPAYDRLWEHFEDRIVDLEVGPLAIGSLIGRTRPQLLISTIPAWAICEKPGEHKFHSVRYYIKQLPTPEADRDHEIVVYNGMPQDRWYRWSILGGKCSIEYPDGVALPDRPDQPFTVGQKAIDNNCDCWPTVHRCGRWAEWRHGITMYKAYQKATQLVEAL